MKTHLARKQADQRVGCDPPRSPRRDDAPPPDGPPALQEANSAKPGRVAARRPLGLLMLEQGTLSGTDLVRALTIQTRHNAQLGDILLAHGMASEETVMQALATQNGTAVLPAEVGPPDPRLIDTLGPSRWLELRCLPWRRLGAVTLVATADPQRFAQHRAEIEAALGPVALAMVPLGRLHQALASCRRAALRLAAETCVAEAESCRAWNGRRFSLALGVILGGIALGLSLAPTASFLLLFSVVMLALLCGATLKTAAALTHFFQRSRTSSAQADPAGAQPGAYRRKRHRLPIVSVMVPLYGEPDIAPRLVRRLQVLTYPRELLDVMIVVEENDHRTRAALSRAALPRWIRVISVPDSALKTKPRALNYALNFALGEIVGVYDAEDAPAHDQLHCVARAFAEGGADLACVQGVLDYYNPKTNWLSRCFTIEYAAWFRLILPGMERLGLAVPLGGTTLFFRRRVLEQLGGWDAHNVTEDADLGIRLARHGYRTTLIDSVTLEEANCQLWPWIRQRSRWLKGYAMTYAVHMREPRLLLTQLGWWRFIGFQVLFLGTLVQFLMAPILWSFWLMLFGVGHPLAASLPMAAAIVVAATFMLTEVANLTINIAAVSGRQHRFLRVWTPTLHLYFPLAVIAAWKGLWEMVTSPYFWDKTTHGLHDSTAQPALGSA